MLKADEDSVEEHEADDRPMKHLALDCASHRVPVNKINDRRIYMCNRDQRRLAIPAEMRTEEDWMAQYEITTTGMLPLSACCISITH
jgi:hypothetical protein